LPAQLCCSAHTRSDVMTPRATQKALSSRHCQTGSVVGSCCLRFHTCKSNKVHWPYLNEWEQAHAGSAHPRIERARRGKEAGARYTALSLERQELRSPGSPPKPPLAAAVCARCIDVAGRHPHPLLRALFRLSGGPIALDYPANGRARRRPSVGRPRGCLVG